MNEIHIINFGPVKKTVINIDKRMQILIGTQASGKSTVCKVVYFCQKIRDYTLDFLMDADQFTANHKSEYFNNYMKYLTRQFMGCFGKTTHMQKFKIIYYFGVNKIEITLNKDGYIRFSFGDGLKNKVSGLLLESSEMFINELNSSKISSIIDNITALAMLKQQLQNRLCDLFENDADIIYIPAGRSLLATMSEKLHEFSISDMDLTMQEFINLIRNTKSKFGTKIPDLVKNYTKTVKGQISNSSLELAYEIIRNIFKADYTSESDGEKIYFDERHWVKLMYGSSGQQEALWILMLSFIIILEKKKCFVVIEEPEAHLFPIAQKKVVDLISLMVNTTGSKAIITTHSPYILTSMNILLYSDKVEKALKGKAVIPKSFRIPFDTFMAYKLDNSADTQDSLENILDEESHMIRMDYIDEVSSVSNAELERLLDRELGE